MYRCVLDFFTSFGSSASAYPSNGHEDSVGLILMD